MLLALQAYSQELLILVADDATSNPVWFGAPLLGWTGEERVGRHVADLVHPDDLSHVLDLVEQARATPGLHATTSARVRHRDGHWLLMDIEVVDARSDPRLKGFVVRLTEAPTVDRSDTASHLGQLEPLAEIVSFGILSADYRGWVVYANEAATELFWRSAEQLRGSGWLEAVHEEDRASVEEAVATAIRSVTRPAVTFRARIGEQTRWLDGRFIALRGADGPAGWVATFNNVTTERELEAELAHLATHDALTGLPNRVLLQDRLDVALARLQRQSGSLSVFFLDLDGFKPINDQHGHAVGDALLVEVAERIRRVVRASDTAARIGGDEFVVISEGLTADEAQRLARRISETVAEPMLLGELEVGVTGCIGVTLTDDPAAKAEQLLSQADQAMYRAKRRGTSIELASGF